MKGLKFLILAVLAIVAGYVIYGRHAAPVPIAAVSYMCNEGKTITARYYKGVSKSAPAPGQPPVPGGSVHITLSDGRDMTLSQTLSADGIRYANTDESFVFWSKGNGALVLENNQQKSYTGCIKVEPDPGNLPQIYESGANGFSIRYPAGYTTDETYRYQELGPGKEIAGVKFTIDPSVATGTNLASDTYLSVEQIPQAKTCSATMFLGDPRAVATTTTDEGTDYSVASTTGAAAGNRYEETIYAIPGTNPCIAVRYFIHYGVFQNYAPGLVREFDKQALLAQFDAIRRTLVIVQ